MSNTKKPLVGKKNSQAGSKLAALITKKAEVDSNAKEYWTSLYEVVGNYGEQLVKPIKKRIVAELKEVTGRSDVQEIKTITACDTSTGCVLEGVARYAGLDVPFSLEFERGEIEALTGKKAQMDSDGLGDDDSESEMSREDKCLEALEKIADILDGMSIDDLSKAERTILNLVLKVLQ